MKRLFIKYFFILLCCYFTDQVNALCQSKSPSFYPGLEWITVTSVEIQDMIELDCQTGSHGPISVIKYSKDTTINGVNYAGIQYEEGTGMVLNTIKYLLRQEGGKVYYTDLYAQKNFPDYSEQLLYDFELEVGDTFSYYSYYEQTLTYTHPNQNYKGDSVGLYETKLVITERDTITTDGNQSRKVLKMGILFYDYYDKNYRIDSQDASLSHLWIEGIGSTLGGILSIFNYAPFYGSYLSCVIDSNKNIYSTGFYECSDLCKNLVNGVKKKDLRNDFHIYPNPASSELFISLPDIQIDNCTVQIFDIYGKLVFDEVLFTKNIQSENKVVLPFGLNGMFYIKLLADDSLLKTKKILILNP